MKPESHEVLVEFMRRGNAYSLQTNRHPVLDCDTNTVALERFLNRVAGDAACGRGT
jgi:hypothetical protein